MKKSISGIRGIFGEDLRLNHVIEFVGNFSHLASSRRCVIARDTRPSGIMMQEIAIATLLQNGIDVFVLGMSPTPIAFREARRFGAGVIVSASHNPLEWNGLKFIIDGRGINEVELTTVLTKQKTRYKTIGEQRYLESSYVNDAVKKIGRIPNAPSVLVDIGGGAAVCTVPELLKELGCNVSTINASVEVSTRGPDPTNDTLADLVNKSPKYDIGFAFDLDGDRLVLVKDGTMQAPDVTLGLGVAKALEMGHKRFVLSVDTSIAVERLVREGGGSIVRSKVGEANVIDTILKTKSHAGGEGSSGGFILPEFNNCRDGILTCGLVASMLQSNRFGEVLDIMGNYYQTRKRVPVKSSLHNRLLEKLASKFSSEFSEIITIDGIRGIVDEDSWVLVRGSNTEDVIRVSAESNDPQKVDEIAENAKSMVSVCHDEIR